MSLLWLNENPIPNHLDDKLTVQVTNVIRSTNHLRDDPERFILLYVPANIPVYCNIVCDTLVWGNY